MIQVEMVTLGCAKLQHWFHFWIPSNQFLSIEVKSDPLRFTSAKLTEEEFFSFFF